MCLSCAYISETTPDRFIQESSSVQSSEEAQSSTSFTHKRKASVKAKQAESSVGRAAKVDTAAADDGRAVDRNFDQVDDYFDLLQFFCHSANASSTKLHEQALSASDKRQLS